MFFIDNLEILSDLTNKEKEQLSLFSQEKVLKKWEVLFSEWDEWMALYFLKSWKIAIFKNKKWEDILLWEVEAEEVIWEMAIFWETNKRMATAIAIENCELVTVLNFSIKEITKKYPKLLEKIQSIIEERTVNNKKIIEDIK